MYFTPALLALVLATTTAKATPHSLLAREKSYAPSGHFTACEHPNFNGWCYNYIVERSLCYNFDEYTSNQFSSYSSDNGWDCTVYSEPNCKRSKKMLGAPGGVVIQDLRVPRGMDNMNRSVRCGITFHPWNTIREKRDVEVLEGGEKMVETLAGVAV